MICTLLNIIPLASYFTNDLLTASVQDDAEAKQPHTFAQFLLRW